MFRSTARFISGRAARAFHSSSRKGGIPRACLTKMSTGPPTAAPMWQLTGVPAGNRGFAATVKSDSDLRRALQAEIELEKQDYKPLEFVAPDPWKVEEKPNSAGVILRRTFGKEDIAVTYVAEPDQLNDDLDDGQEIRDDDMDELPPEDFGRVPFTVSVSKDGDSPPLEFLCVTHGGTDVVIENVNLNTKGEEFAYDGPLFESLDENLQKRFENYLNARGVNEELATYITESLRDKEQREYMNWLKNVDAFVKK